MNHKSLFLLPFLLLPVMAVAASDPARDAILQRYGAEATKSISGFAGFSAQRGETLFRTKWSGGEAKTPSCTACHTGDPRAQGRNAITGRPIEAVAPSVTPKRFTNWDDVEKQFTRDCNRVIGRACTSLEKGDYIAFMAGQ